MKIRRFLFTLHLVLITIIKRQATLRKLIVFKFGKFCNSVVSATSA